MDHRIATLRTRLRDPSLTILLLVQVVIIFGLGPLLSFGIEVPPGIVAVTLLAIIVVVVVASPSNGPMVVVLFALLVYAVTFIIRRIEATAATDWMGVFGSALAIAGVSWVVAGTVFAPGRMNEHRVVGAVVLYLNIAMLFEALYRLLAERAPGSFSGMPEAFDYSKSVGDLMYFSMTTLTTVGYGDIAPVHPIARSLSNLEALVGQLYPAIILARIVTLYKPKD